MLNAKLLVLTGLLLSCVLRIATLEASVHQYQISIDENIAHATVKICFDGTAPDYLTIDSREGNRDLVKFPDSKQGRIEIQGRYWKTKFLPKDACLSYQVNLERHHAKRTKANKSRKNIAYIESNTWLWLPEAQSKHDDIKLTFSLPNWASISAPWQQTAANRYEFILGHHPQDWGYTLLIGDFEQHLVEISKGHQLNIATVRSSQQREKITRWLLDTATALEHYLGDYPSEQTQIVVIEKNKKSHGPVPWGDFSRGNGYGIRFVVVPSYAIEDFYADWTATHEFSHQLLPKLEYKDIWLSEGLSSYLQYVLMGQSGRLNKEEAWSRIHQGFMRGQKGTAKVAKEPLQLTANRRKGGGRAGRTMRIYWSGAAYFLHADLALRKASNGKVGLNNILLKFNHCCSKQGKIWSGQELATKLDELSNSKIFLESYRQVSNSTEFPEFSQTLAQLGVLIPSDGSGNVKIKSDSFAQAIMR